MTENTWPSRIRAQLARVVDDGRWRTPREFDAARAGGRARGSGGGVLRVERLSRVERAPGGGGGGARGARAVGRRIRRIPPGDRAPAPSTASSRRRWRSGRGPRPPSASRPGSPPTWACSPCSAGPGVRVLSDELNHASIIDGCRLSRSALTVYRHRDMDHLEELLSATAGADPTGAATPTIVVTDSVFSMDGDVAPVDELLDMSRRHGALLVLDEAHAVLGPHLPAAGRDGAGAGGGDREAQGGTVVRVGTLSKTLGSLGGFVAASRDVVDLLVNRARSYIFSTAPTPADAAAALAALTRPAVRRRRCPDGSPRLPDRPALGGRPRPAGTSEPDRPHRPRVRAGGARSLGVPVGAGAVGAGHPPAHRPGRHQPAAGDAVGGAHRRGRDPVARCARPPAPPGARRPSERWLL